MERSENVQVLQAKISGKKNSKKCEKGGVFVRFKNTHFAVLKSATLGFILTLPRQVFKNISVAKGT